MKATKRDLTTMWNLRRNFLPIVTIFAGTLIQVSNGFEWTASSPPDGSTVETCVGEKVSLQWQYSITAEETVMNVQWHKSTGDGKTILATHLSGHLLKFPYVHVALTFLPNAGLEMGNFTLEDYTTYFVTVHYTREGSYFSRSRSVTLVLPDAPVLTDRRLVANILPDFVTDVTTGQLHVQLTCGKFQKLGSRPVSVMWLTPSGAKVPSTSYADGNFHLTLPNPVQGGGYQCQLKDPSLVARCVRDMSTFVGGSYVHVDEVHTRLLLLESGVKGLSSHDNSLTSDVRNLQDGLAKHRALCPDDFPLEHGDSCYSISIADKNFAAAKAACEATGGKLAEIETPGENEFLRLYARLDGTTAYWIGGSDQAREGNFVWVSDNRPITYATWTNGQPDDGGGNEDCVEIRVVGSLWNDRVCTVRNRYICETSRPQ